MKKIKIDVSTPCIIFGVSMVVVAITIFLTFFISTSSSLDSSKEFDILGIGFSIGFSLALGFCFVLAPFIYKDLIRIIREKVKEDLILVLEEFRDFKPGIISSIIERL